MRKIYSLVLMAAALLVGTNAWAQTNGKVKIVRTGVEYDGLQLAFDDAQDGDLLELTNNRTEAMDIAAWFGEPTSGTLENFASTDRSITLDLKGYTYTIDGDAPYKIALTRGVLTIQSTGGKGNIVSNKNGIAVYGTYLKIDAKNTPFAHLMIKENVKITSEEKTVVLNTPVTPNEASSSWKWNTYPLDYNCCIFPVSQHGISNGARIDVFGELVGKKYAVQVSGNIRSSREFINEDGSRKTVYYSGVEQPSNLEIFPIYWKKSDTEELYLPGTTLTDKTKNGTTGTPTYYGGTSYYYNSTISNTDDYVLAWGDDASYSSYVHIHPSAILTTNNPTSPNATAFYSAGYARCYIEGTCKGSTGVYVKGGEVELHDAQVSSNYADPYVPADGSRNSGVNAGGSGVVVESNKGWTGNMEVTVSGDTYVEGSTGYAIDESVTSSPTTKVDIINIEGGTFVGGTAGTVTISETTVIANQQDPEDVQIIIAGGNMQNGTTTIGTQDLEDFLGSQDNNTHVTTVTVDGKTTMVVSEGAAPTSEQTQNAWSDIALLATGSNAAWTGTGDPDDANFESSNGYGLISTGTPVKLGELQMISGTGANDKQVLVIQNGATLDTRHLIMNDYAQIIVEAGGKLIVEGEQGIVAPKTSNIVLKADADNYAQFLFNPEVTSNRHPNATIELISDSYRVSSTDRHNQPFGVPTSSKLKNIYTDRTSNRVAFWRYNYVSDGWENIGYLYPDAGQTDLNFDDLSDPFGYYQMLCTSNTTGTKVTMEGELVGNDNHNVSYLAHFYMGFANSYTADIDLMTILPTIPGVNKAVYIYTKDDEGHYAWTSNTSVAYETTKIAPMQAFVLLNRGAATSSVINYRNMVWTPATSSAAPARVKNYDAQVKIRINNSTYSDYVTLVQHESFTDEFDLGEAEKYMNADVNIYVTEDTPLGIFASNDINNTYLGFNCKDAGTYTLKFTEVLGENFVFVDLQNNAVIPMTTGFTYQFDAVSNESNDYRFQIRKVANVVTNIESINIETGENSGIYTITGQYVGNMSIWNTLPSGMYIVDGVKKVK